MPFCFSEKPGHSRSKIWPDRSQRFFRDREVTREEAIAALRGRGAIQLEVDPSEFAAARQLREEARSNVPISLLPRRSSPISFRGPSGEPVNTDPGHQSPQPSANLAPVDPAADCCTVEEMEAAEIGPEELEKVRRALALFYGLSLDMQSRIDRREFILNTK